MYCISSLGFIDRIEETFSRSKNFLGSQQSLKTIPAIIEELNTKAIHTWRLDSKNAWFQRVSLSPILSLSSYNLQNSVTKADLGSRRPWPNPARLYPWPPGCGRSRLWLWCSKAWKQIDLPDKGTPQHPSDAGGEVWAFQLCAVTKNRGIIS